MGKLWTLVLKFSKFGEIKRHFKNSMVFNDSLGETIESHPFNFHKKY